MFREHAKPRGGELGSLADITTEQAVSEQLAIAQRMEAVGRLAGGVAHDLNNILGPLVGYPDLILEQMPPDSPLRADIAEIRDSLVKVLKAVA